MSAETMEWLNTRVLVGYTDKRGHAWHYRAGEYTGEPNHYPGPIPVEDVRRRLFNWRPATGTVHSVYQLPDGTGRDTITDDDRKTIIRPRGTLGDDDPGAIIGVFKSGYQPHEFNQWLIEHVEGLLSAELAIGSAGLLKGGALAWVQVELEDTLTAAGGVQHRPYMTAATSLDGSLKTTYTTGTTVSVCDNTLQWGLAEAKRRGTIYKVKHTAHSLGRFEEVRQAIDLVEAVGKQVDAGIREMLDAKVTDQQFDQFAEAFVWPGGKPEKPGRALTTGQNKVAKLRNMWATDERVAPWRNTAWGALQAANTFEHHEGSIRGGDRVGRNMLKMVTGTWASFDEGVRGTLADVLG